MWHAVLFAMQGGLSPWHCQEGLALVDGLDATLTAAEGTSAALPEQVRASDIYSSCLDIYSSRLDIYSSCLSIYSRA